MKEYGRFTFAFLCYATISVAQQDTGMITGQVTDGNGFAVPAASVAVTNRDTNVGIKVVTGSDGIFVATPLKIGMYSLQVEAKGFKKALRDGIQIQVQDRVRLDFQLEVGDVTQTVEVQASAPLLQSESTSLGEVINQRSVAELPLNGRNFTQLIVLAPGAYIPQRNNSLYRSLLVGINGNRVQNNNFLLDDSDLSLRSSVFFPTRESRQENSKCALEKLTLSTE